MEDPAAVHTRQAHWHDARWYRLLAGTTPQSIAFLAGIADYDPIPALMALKCPLLAIFGAHDLLVPVDESVRVLTGTLAAAGHTDHQIVIFPGADHNIRIFSGEGLPQVRHGLYMPGELVVTWLQGRLVC